MTTKSKAAKNVKATAARNTEAYRLVARGVNAKGKYKRRVFIVRGSYEQAAKALETRVEDLTQGFKSDSVFLNIFEGAQGSGYVNHNNH